MEESLLNNNDKQRIEQMAGVFRYDSLGFRAYIQGAKDATLYERQRQAKSMEELNNAAQLHVTMENGLVEKIKQLEAERSELRNKVIDEAIAGLKKIGYGGQGFEYNDSSIFEILNSLKTK